MKALTLIVASGLMVGTLAGCVGQPVVYGPVYAPPPPARYHYPYAYYYPQSYYYPYSYSY